MNEYPKLLWRDGRAEQLVVHDLAGENSARQAGYVADHEVALAAEREVKERIPVPAPTGRAVKGVAGDDVAVAGGGVGQKGVPHPPGRADAKPAPEEDQRLPEEKQQEAQIAAAAAVEADKTAKDNGKTDKDAKAAPVVKGDR